MMRLYFKANARFIHFRLLWRIYTANMQACFTKDYVTISYGSASNTLLSNRKQPSFSAALRVCMNILLSGMEQFNTGKVVADAASAIPEHARRLDWIKVI